MNVSEKSVATADELVAATKDKGSHHIVVHGDLTNAPTISLSPGQSLRGEGEGATVTFANDADGLQLSSDNRIHNIRLNGSPDKRAILTRVLAGENLPANRARSTGETIWLVDKAALAENFRGR